MIKRHETVPGREDVWGQLRAPLDPDDIQWRQDGKATQRDAKFFARFVAYIDANTVRERLDTVVPGEWDLTLELLPVVRAAEEGGEVEQAFKARLQILGTIREDVGLGRDYKAAATDAFKRAATRFGIGNELYDFDQNWVEVDGGGKYPRPVEEPGEAYARRVARKAGRQRPVQSPTTNAGVAKPPKGRVQDALAPNKNGKPWSNDIDPHVQFTEEGVWLVNGIDIETMEDQGVEAVKKTATVKGYTALARAANDLLARRALGEQK